MLIHEALERHLQSQTTAKIYANIAPEKAVFPFIVYIRHSTIYSHVLGNDSGYNDSYFQIDIYDTNAKSAQELGKTIRKSLMNFTGEMGAFEETSGVEIQSVIIENESDGFENDTNLFRAMQEYKITYLEEV